MEKCYFTDFNIIIKFIAFLILILILLLVISYRIKLYITINHNS